NYFFIGSNNQLSMGQSGRLFLCYNDVANSFNNNTGGYRVSINRISDPNQQNTAGRSPSPSQQTQIGRSPQFSQNINQFNRFEIGKLSTGEKVLRVPKQYMQQTPFREALQRPIRPSSTREYTMRNDDYGVFLWDGKRLQFTSYTVYKITDFQVGDKTYWLTETSDITGFGNLEISKPYFLESKIAFSGESGGISIIGRQKNNSAIFIIKVVEGNGWNLPITHYSLDLSNPKKPVVSRLVILQKKGILQDGDPINSSDGSLYNSYTFQGYAGQSITINLDTRSFSSYLVLIAPDGKKIADNRGTQRNPIVEITVTLPSTGTYKVVVNGRDRTHPQGRYILNVNSNQMIATGRSPSPSQQTTTGRSPSPSQQTTTGRSPSPNQQTTTGRSPASNQQTATRTVQPVRQTFSSVKSLGMAQFLWESTELKSAQETLQKATRGEYNTITNGQKIDFFEEGITEIRPVDCRSFGFSCESKEITYADYLNLKLKVYLQVGVFKNGMKVYDEIPKYQNRLFQERRYGGLNVGQNLTSEWEKRWNNVKEQQRLKDKQANLPITERLGVVMEQTIKDTANFSWELFKTSTKVAATLAQIKDLADTITSLTSINQYNLNRISGGPKYTIAAVKILTDAGKALQSFDTDKLNELTLKAAQETIELINAQDRKVAGSANVIKIYFAAKDIIDKNKLLRQPQATNALDEFDRFYIAAAMYSKAVDVIIGGLSIPFSEAKVVDTLLKKADAVNTVLFEALEFTYKDSVRRQYVRLQYAYNRNQIQVVGLSSFIDYAAEEVGKYLLKARPDLVTQRPDGTIAVSVDGVVYPP
ncbi:PPC domain-containing protein, partial [Microcoleus anatoxicus]|uniref:PPC domain-containing protein n=1 Tax=Microcoleus anatoxicus TaxID=2705319 RepID=UPI0030C975E9